MHRSAVHSVWIALAATLVAGGFVTTRAAWAETVSLPGAFEPDLAELQPSVLGKLAEIADKARPRPGECPDKIKIKVVVKRGGDPLFLRTLGKARWEAIWKFFKRHDVQLGPFSPDIVDIDGPRDDVQISRVSGDDEDPTLLVEFRREGEKIFDRTKVKRGDRIRIDMRARDVGTRETKPCQMGIARFQVIANGVLADARDYEKSECDKEYCQDGGRHRSWYTTITVKREHAPTLRLELIAEDHANKNDTVVVEFPFGDSYGECVPGGFKPKMMESMAWGTWTGTISVRSEGKNFDRLMPGHNQPHARVFTAYRGDTTANVTLRSGSDYPDAVKFGHGEGAFSGKQVSDTRWGDPTNPVETKHDEKENSGDVGASEGRLRLDKNTGRLKYDISISGPSLRVSGEMCRDQSLRGESVDESGKPDSWSYSRRVTKWSFSFSPGEPPPHVKRFESVLQQTSPWLDVGTYERKVSDILSELDREYNRRNNQDISPLYREAQRLHQEGRNVEARELSERAQKAMEQLNKLFAKRYDIGKELNAPHNNYYSQAGRTLERQRNEIWQTYRRLSELWLSNERDADARYQERLTELKGTVDRWKETKKSIEEEYAKATERAADQAQSMIPDVARKLRELASILRRDGM